MKLLFIFIDSLLFMLAFIPIVVCLYFIFYFIEDGILLTNIWTSRYTMLKIFLLFGEQEKNVSGFYKKIVWNGATS